jgi:hypothetical protein
MCILSVFSPPRSDTLGSKSLTLKCFSPLPYLCNLLAHPVCWSPKLVKENSQGTRRGASSFLFKLHLTPTSLSGNFWEISGNYLTFEKKDPEFFLLAAPPAVYLIFDSLCCFSVDQP